MSIMHRNLKGPTFAAARGSASVTAQTDSLLPPCPLSRTGGGRATAALRAGRSMLERAGGPGTGPRFRIRTGGIVNASKMRSIFTTGYPSNRIRGNRGIHGAPTCRGACRARRNSLALGAAPRRRCGRYACLGRISAIPCPYAKLVSPSVPKETEIEEYHSLGSVPL